MGPAPLRPASRPPPTRRPLPSLHAHAQDRPLAVDYEISTADDWAYALLLGGASPPGRFAFEPAASAGWRPALPFSTDEHPFSILAPARPIPACWGFWDGTNITAQPPPSPVAGCDSAQPTRLRLVPFGATNLRISVFPWARVG